MSTDGHHQSPAKRRRLSPPVLDFLSSNESFQPYFPRNFEEASVNLETAQFSKAGRKGNITLSATSKLAGQTVTPFLLKHIPDQYAPMGGVDSTGSPKAKDSNTKYCYRHRPDLKCRRQANEPSMEQLQNVGISGLRLVMQY